MKSSNKNISADRLKSQSRLDNASLELPLSHQGRDFYQAHAAISASAAENGQRFLKSTSREHHLPWDGLPAPTGFVCSGTGLCQLQVTVARPRESPQL